MKFCYIKGVSMRLKNLSLIALCVAVVMSGCATLPKTKTHDVPVADTKESSKSVESLKPNQPKGLKRKVAIGRFSNETRYGNSFFLDKNNDRIGKQAMDILSAKLFKTGKFIMLERADLDKIEKELAMGGSKKLRNAADYIIVGSITEFGRKDVSDVGVFSRTKKQEAFAKVHIRIIDVSTGEIIYSDEGKGTAFSQEGTVLGVGGKAGYDAQLNDKAIDAAISNLVSNIVEHMLDKPWKGYILDEQEGAYVISGGKSQNIKVGDVFYVYKRGKKIKNPQTNTYIELPGKRIATLRVTATLGSTPESEVSLTELIEGEIPKDFSSLYIQPKGGTI